MCAQRGTGMVCVSDSGGGEEDSSVMSVDGTRRLYDEDENVSLDGYASRILLQDSRKRSCNN